jgi:myo-inositol 2-dehydrogenase/D-chiro-inositol 1-dehydrogenase
MLKICQFGAGRIGAIHAENVARHPRAKLAYVVDVAAAARDALAAKHGAIPLDAPDRALADPEVGAVIIASSTPTHVDLILRSARAKKAIFCEKPIDLDLRKVDACLEELNKAGVPFLIAFNRRFDPSFARLERELRAGRIGQLEMVQITSRDPRPPPADYVRVSGGLFRDMMIHDLDMARWLLAEEPVELYAQASCLVDPSIGAAGDVDTAMVTLRTASGKLAQISNSRRAVYGYDQRIEVFGSGGMIQAGNHSETSVRCWGQDGVTGDPPLDFFLQRYADAYRVEMNSFVEGVLGGRALSPGPSDGRRALVLAEAAIRSLAEKRAVEVAP